MDRYWAIIGVCLESDITNRDNGNAEKYYQKTSRQKRGCGGIRKKFLASKVFYLLTGYE